MCTCFWRILTMSNRTVSAVSLCERRSTTAIDRTSNVDRCAHKRIAQSLPLCVCRVSSPCVVPSLMCETCGRRFVGVRASGSTSARRPADEDAHDRETSQDENTHTNRERAAPSELERPTDDRHNPSRPPRAAVPPPLPPPSATLLLELAAMPSSVRVLRLSACLLGLLLGSSVCLSVSGAPGSDPSVTECPVSSAMGAPTVDCRRDAAMFPTACTGKCCNVVGNCDSSSCRNNFGLSDAGANCASATCQAQVACTPTKPSCRANGFNHCLGTAHCLTAACGGHAEGDLCVYDGTSDNYKVCSEGGIGGDPQFEGLRGQKYQVHRGRRTRARTHRTQTETSTDRGRGAIERGGREGAIEGGCTPHRSRRRGRAARGARQRGTAPAPEGGEGAEPQAPRSGIDVRDERERTRGSEGSWQLQRVAPPTVCAHTSRAHCQSTGTRSARDLAARCTSPRRLTHVLLCLAPTSRVDSSLVRLACAPVRPRRR
jgi:hypothetical protein